MFLLVIKGAIRLVVSSILHFWTCIEVPVQ